MTYDNLLLAEISHNKPVYEYIRKQFPARGEEATEKEADEGND